MAEESAVIGDEVVAVLCVLLRAALGVGESPAPSVEDEHALSMLTPRNSADITLALPRSRLLMLSLPGRRNLHCLSW